PASYFVAPRLIVHAVRSSDHVAMKREDGRGVAARATPPDDAVEFKPRGDGREVVVDLVGRQIRLQTDAVGARGPVEQQHRNNGGVCRHELSSYPRVARQARAPSNAIASGPTASPTPSGRCGGSESSRTTAFALSARLRIASAMAQVGIS